MNMNLHKAIRPAPRPHGDMYTGPNVRGSRQELIVRPSELSIGTDGTYGEQPSSPKSGAISTDVADSWASDYISDIGSLDEFDLEESWGSKRRKTRHSSETSTDSMKIEQLWQQGSVLAQAATAHQKFWKLSRQQAEEMAEVKNKFHAARCKIYDKKTPMQTVEDDMETSEEDDSPETRERKRIERVLQPVKWKDLHPGVQLEILHNLESNATSADEAIAVLRLNRSERQSAMELLYHYYDFHQKAANAQTSFSQQYMQYEEQMKRNLTRGEVQDLMQQTILGVQGNDEFDKPVKELDIELGRTYLEERLQNPCMITLRPDLSPWKRSKGAHDFEANASPYLRLAFEHGPMAFPTLPLDATTEQIRNAPRRRPGSSDAVAEVTTLAEMAREQEERLVTTRRPAVQCSSFGSTSGDRALHDPGYRSSSSQVLKALLNRCSANAAEARRGRSEQPRQPTGAK